VTKRRSRGTVFYDKRRQCWMGYIADGTMTANGRPRRRSFRGRSRSEVQQKLRKIEAAVLLDKPVVDGSMKVATFLEEWFTTSVEPNCLSANTADSYRRIVRHHLIPTLGKRRLRDLSVLDVDQLLAAKYDAGYSGSTVQRIRMTLIRALRHAERRDLVARNVAALCDLRRTKPKEGRSLTPDQAAKLLAVAPSDRLGITVELGLYLGLRPGEVLGLQWGDIDFDQRTLRVRRSLKREQNRLRFGEPKTPGSRRILAMPDPLVAALQRHRNQQNTDRECADDMWTEFDLVVTTEVGTPVDPSNARRTLDRLCDETGIGHWNPNALRHSFASLLSLRGAPMEEVADAMGHVDTRMTSRVYRHNLKSVVDVAAVHFGSLQ
jgi:integrase